LTQGETIHLMVARQKRLDWLRRKDLDAHLWRPLIEEFERLHPTIRVSLLTVSEEELEKELRRRTARGLGPDLIFARAPAANTLLDQGLIAPVPRTPAIDRSIAELNPNYLRRVRYGSELSGLPIVELVSLACYNRQAMPTPPRTTRELIASASAGHTVGLSIDGFGIWWTAGTEGAAEAVVPLLFGESPATPTARQEVGTRITAWLRWLRQLAGQSRVDLATGPEELSQGLISGRLDWIPCYSLTLMTLKSAMGNRLGVSALPSGPGGSPSPLNTLQVLAFGLDSSERQRANSMAFARLIMDPVLQRRVVLQSEEVLSVNRFVQIPVASSGVLAALKEASLQAETVTPIFSRPFTLERLDHVVPQLESVIQQVMVGVLTPEEGARRILSFGDSGR
jgi:ABC-type glycerol-3-phosphate transport system substrate-binding protein